MESEKIRLKKWLFFKGDIKNGEKLGLNENEKWNSIEVPHTWNKIDALNGGSRKFALNKEKRSGYYRGPCWYRTTINIPEVFKNKRFFLRFEAVGTVADVFINEIHIEHHKGGFSAFCIELPSDLIRFDKENLLCVRANNAHRSDLPPLSGDFPVMGGIYRPVSLMIKNKTCISPLDYASPGVYITQKQVTKQKAEIGLKTLILSDEDTKEINLRISVFNATKISQVMEKKVKLKDKSLNEYKYNFEIINPHLWQGLNDPHLYMVKIELFDDGNLLDKVEQAIGIRFFEFNPKTGFLLNGVSYPIYGVCRHQDRAEKGWAISEKDQEEDILLMKEMGVRGVRLAHYQHSDYFYDLCDTHGILVWTEIALVNKVNFSREFWENTANMLIELIRQNYNHSSIFTWGLCNELGIFQFRNPSSIIRKLHNLAKTEDSSRLTTLAAIPQAKFRKGLYDITDILGVNLYPGWYYKYPNEIKVMISQWNSVRKEQGLAVSEYGAGASINQHEESPSPKGSFLSAGGAWHPEEKQNLIHEITFKHISNSPFVWGSFVWNMFDFAVPTRNEGDSPGRNDKGLVTYDRKIRKDAFYYYKANLTNKPMVYITSRRYIQRTKPITDIKVYSNSPEVHLSLNNNYIGKMKKEEMNIHSYSKVKLVPGKNLISVKITTDGEEISDQCEWNLN